MHQIKRNHTVVEQDEHDDERNRDLEVPVEGLTPFGDHSSGYPICLCFDLW